MARAGSYRLTGEADRPPNNCAVSGRFDGPFVDFGVQLDLPMNAPYNLFLHQLVVEDAAKGLGMVKGDYAQELEAEVEKLRTELADAQKFVKLAADYKEARERIVA